MTDSRASRLTSALADRYHVERLAQNTTSYDVTADGQRFLMARDPRLAEGSGRGELILVRNFAEEVKRRLGG